MLLENSIDERCGAIIKLPQRCVLNKSWDRLDIPGYFVTFDPHCVSSPATLFIADTPDGRLFHEAFQYSLIVTLIIDACGCMKKMLRS